MATTLHLEESSIASACSSCSPCSAAEWPKQCHKRVHLRGPVGMVMEYGSCTMGLRTLPRSAGPRDRGNGNADTAWTHSLLAVTIPIFRFTCPAWSGDSGTKVFSLLCPANSLRAVQSVTSALVFHVSFAARMLPYRGSNSLGANERWPLERNLSKRPRSWNLSDDGTRPVRTLVASSGMTTSLVGSCKISSVGPRVESPKISFSSLRCGSITAVG
mmetsp:Transcript_7376/g.12410  ORF Transcript_7376/g.12410 Transcript_7376/m.12410 type:complete len:216 (+) Transcript_7376:1765-2412(+)